VPRIHPHGHIEPEVLVVREQLRAREEELDSVLALRDPAAPVVPCSWDGERGGVARVVVFPVVEFAPDMLVRVVLRVPVSVSG